MHKENDFGHILIACEVFMTPPFSSSELRPFNIYGNINLLIYIHDIHTKFSYTYL